MRKSKRQSNKNALLGVFGLVIICGISQAIITSQTSLKMAKLEPKSSESYVVSTLTKKSLESSQVAKFDTSTSSLEYISNGDRVIRTKTDYFENEVTAYLASEQACKIKGMGDECINTLLGMGYAENRDFNYKSVGADGYTSYGLFQISRHYHPEVTVEQALDPYFSAIWTLNRLVAYGYPEHRDTAVRLHNGSPTNPKTLTYLNTVNKYISM